MPRIIILLFSMNWFIMVIVWSEVSHIFHERGIGLGINCAFVVFSPFLVYLPQALALFHLVRRKQVDGGEYLDHRNVLLFYPGSSRHHKPARVLLCRRICFWAIMGDFLHYNYRTREKNWTTSLLHIFNLDFCLLGLLEGFGVIDSTPAGWKTFWFNNFNPKRWQSFSHNGNIRQFQPGCLLVRGNDSGGLSFYENLRDENDNCCLQSFTVNCCFGDDRFQGAFIGLLLGLVVYDLVKGRMFHFILRILILLGLVVLSAIRMVPPRSYCL